MVEWSYGDFVLHLVAYTRGAYTAKEIEALADSVWKKHNSPKFKLIKMETENATLEGLLEEDDLEEHQDEHE